MKEIVRIKDFSS